MNMKGVGDPFEGEAALIGIVATKLCDGLMQESFLLAQHLRGNDRRVVIVSTRERYIIPQAIEQHAKSEDVRGLGRLTALKELRCKVSWSSSDHS